MKEMSEKELLRMRKAAGYWGSMGGKKGQAMLTPEQRSKRGSEAVKKRWQYAASRKGNR